MALFLPRSLQPILGIAISAGIVLSAFPSLAAERIVIKYGPLRESVSVAELAALAETGEPSSDLEAYMRMADKEPAEIQKVLNRSIKADPVKLDRLLNSPLGAIALDKLAEAIHTPGEGGADREALRAALVLSASQDGKITLIEALQNYPTQEVQVEGDKVVKVMKQFSRFQRQADQVRDVLQILK